MGMDGIRTFIQELLRQPRFLAAVLAVLYSAAQLMFDIRAREAAAGRRVCALPDPYCHVPTAG